MSSRSNPGVHRASRLLLRRSVCNQLRLIRVVGDLFRHLFRSLSNRLHVRDLVCGQRCEPLGLLSCAWRQHHWTVCHRLERRDFRDQGHAHFQDDCEDNRCRVVLCGRSCQCHVRFSIRCLCHRHERCQCRSGPVRSCWCRHRWRPCLPPITGSTSTNRQRSLNSAKSSSVVGAFAVKFMMGSWCYSSQCPFGWRMGLDGST